MQVLQNEHVVLPFVTEAYVNGTATDEESLISDEIATIHATSIDVIVNLAAVPDSVNLVMAAHGGLVPQTVVLANTPNAGRYHFRYRGAIGASCKLSVISLTRPVAAVGWIAARS